MTLPVEIVGQRFGRLVVLRRVENDRHGKSQWVCRCDCGNETTTRANTLLKGETRSCGCLHLETVRVSRLTHGAASRLRNDGQQDPVYRVWCAAKGRCHNPTDKSYINYGQRGIKMCKRWRESFEAFRDDMGPRPVGGTLERQDNDGNYDPDNCRWATGAEQARNKRTNIKITWKGETRCLYDWAHELGMKPMTLYFRIQTSGWTVYRAFTTPVRKMRRPHHEDRA